MSFVHDTKDLGADTNRIMDNQGNAQTYGAFGEGEAPKATAYGDTSKSADAVFKALDENDKKTVLDAADDESLAKYTQINETGVEEKNNPYR